MSDFAEDRLYKLAEVEKLLSCSRSTLRRWIKDKKLKAVKIGGSGPKSQSPWRVRESELRKFRSGGTE